MKQQVDPQWYSKVFTLDVVEMLWTDSTMKEVDWILETLNLSKGEKILDLACGFGRHAIELARRGFQVVGVDLSKELIDYAKDKTKQLDLPVGFICEDLRNLSFDNEFDVVLSLFDGAIGYFETEEENLKTFKVIAGALKIHGKHLLNIPNAEYARKYFPKRTWSAGSKSIELLEFDWNKKTKFMFATTYPIRYGDIFQELIPIHGRQRIYDIDELQSIFTSLNMKILQTHGDFRQEALSEDDMYMCVLSTKV